MSASHYADRRRFKPRVKAALENIGADEVEDEGLRLRLSGCLADVPGWLKLSPKNGSNVSTEAFTDPIAFKCMVFPSCVVCERCVRVAAA